MKKKAKLKFNKKKVVVIDELETTQVKGGASGVLCIPTIISLPRTFNPRDCGITIACN